MSGKNFLEVRKEHREFIVETTGSAPNSCTCEACVSACYRTPCLGTPLDIVAIIAAGHENKLSRAIWAVDAYRGVKDAKPIVLVQPKYDRAKKSCVFLVNDRCSLHDLGLKPTEGVLSSCNESQVIELAEQGKVAPVRMVAYSWLDPQFQSIVKPLLEKYR